MDDQQRDDHPEDAHAQYEADVLAGVREALIRLLYGPWERGSGSPMDRELVGIGLAGVYPHTRIITTLRRPPDGRPYTREFDLWGEISEGGKEHPQVLSTIIYANTIET
jgi:hypothetical protein